MAGTKLLVMNLNKNVIITPSVSTAATCTYIIAIICLRSHRIAGARPHCLIVPIGGEFVGAVDVVDMLANAAWVHDRV